MPSTFTLFFSLIILKGKFLVWIIKSLLKTLSVPPFYHPNFSQTRPFLECWSFRHRQLPSSHFTERWAGRGICSGSMAWLYLGTVCFVHHSLELGFLSLGFRGLMRLLYLRSCWPRLFRICGPSWLFTSALTSCSSFAVWWKMACLRLVGRMWERLPVTKESTTAQVPRPGSALSKELRQVPLLLSTFSRHNSVWANSS